MITKDNIAEFVKYIAEAKGKNFDHEKIEGWKKLDESELRNAINKLYVHLGIDDDEKIKLLEEFKLRQLPEDPVVEQNSIQTHTPTYATAVPAQPVYHQPVYATTAPPQKAKSKMGLLVLGGVLLLMVLFLSYKYMQYTGLGNAYALTDNIAIRQSADKNSRELGRMDMFGKYMRPDGQVTTSYSEFKIIGEDEYNYTKVAFDNSFLSWLTGSSKEGYVHTKYIGKDKLQFENYRRIFKNINDDYNELDKLQFIYRKVIYNGIVNSNSVKHLVVKAPCFKSPKLDIKLRLSIAQMKNRKNGSVAGYTAIVQLSDNQYYTIEGDLNGEIKHLYKTRLFGEDMKIQGKFKYFPGSDYEDKHIELKPCNSNETYDAYEPFIDFNAEYYGC